MQSVRAKVYGIVQGVGFRPTVDMHAKKHQVTGSVCNKGPFVEIIAQGESKQVDAFLHDVEYNPPKRAVILKMDIEVVDYNKELTGFSIIESSKVSGEIFVSPDIAICEDCMQEIFDKKKKSLSSLKFTIIWSSRIRYNISDIFHTC